MFYHGKTRGSYLCFTSLLFLLLWLRAGVATANAAPPSPRLQASSNHAYFDPAGEAQLVSLVNQERAQQGLQPLKVDERLTRAARKHSELMAQHSALSHDFEGEPPLQIRIANENLYADRVSENIAYNNRTIEAAHDGLMHSPPHREAILSPDFDAVGVGVLRVGDEIYVTEDFAHKLPEYSEPQAEAVVESAIARYMKSHGLLAPVRHPQLSLRKKACDMARDDKLESSDALQLPGVHGVLAWTASDPAKLPKGIAQVVAPEVSGYSLGACFAPSVSHPGGVYWIVMVTY
ncbi:MAG TPA: CAP domain-containing protein [Terriglobales bacterium]|jgi:uncharacterized protein YkwD|nr:CAP domain-containing protein [Terriglobales bacterium]